MGRQLEIFMTPKDEVLLLDYLFQVGEIVLLEPHFDRIDGFVKSSFSPEFSGHWLYFIWNKRFAWKPEVRESNTGIERYSISNISNAPVIEFSRSNMARNKSGRIYWSKYFSAPHGLNYDVDEFSNWYDSLVKWIKKNAAGKTKYSNWVTYYLPDAWKIYNERLAENPQTM